MTEQLYRWVKASERMPEGRVIARWNHGGDPEAERIDILDKQQMEMFDNVSEAPTLEWLEPYTPSLNAGSLEEAAESHANTVAIEEGFHTADNQHTINLLRIAFASGAAYEKGDIDKVVEQLREENPYCGEIDFSEDARIAWGKACDKLKELLNQSK